MTYHCTRHHSQSPHNHKQINSESSEEWHLSKTPFKRFLSKKVLSEKVLTQKTSYLNTWHRKTNDATEKQKKRAKNQISTKVQWKNSTSFWRETFSQRGVGENWEQRLARLAHHNSVF